jgi:hypothetical protein
MSCVLGIGTMTCSYNQVLYNEAVIESLTVSGRLKLRGSRIIFFILERIMGCHTRLYED